MFSVISPAKTLDYESPLPKLPEQTTPRQLEKSQQLVQRLQDYSAKDLAALMGVSDKIAQLNVERFANWQTDMQSSQARPAVLAFRGDTYTGLDIDSFKTEELMQAQNSLRILSGLYGLLRPLDRIRPYRLEMGTKLTNPQGKNLYSFWGEQITQYLASDMAKQGSDILVNLASQEYFKAIKPKALPAQIITPVFKDEKNSQFKVISFYAKKARGALAGWIAKNNPRQPKDLRAFNALGYQWSAKESSPEAPVFKRLEKHRQ